MTQAPFLLYPVIFINGVSTFLFTGLNRKKKELRFMKAGVF